MPAGRRKGPALGRSQDALYRAEDEALLGLGRRFADIREARSYVAELVEEDFFVAAWPHVTGLDVHRRSSGATWSLSANGSPQIYLAPIHLREAVLLHEVAHQCTPGAGHGPVFARAFLALVRRRMGFHAYGALLSALQAAEPFQAADLRVAA